MNTINYLELNQYQNDTLTDEQINSIAAQLINNAENADYCYLLLDLSLRDLSDLALENSVYAYIKNNYATLQFIRFDHPMFNTKNVPALLLLDLKQDDQIQLLKQSIKLSFQETNTKSLLSGKGRAICGWLFSNEKGEELSHYLANLCIQKDAITHRYSLLRLYDPAVLSSVLSLILPQIRDKILGATTCWAILNGDGLLTCYKASTVRRQFTVHRLGLDDKEMQHIANIGLENQTLLRYRDNKINQPRYHEDQAREYIRNALTLCDQYQLTDEQDKILFAMHYLTIGSEFHRTPIIAKLLKQKETYYQKRAASITDEQWHQIAQQSKKLASGESDEV
ncbi:hypothetical protein A9G34_07100 [Gilliamella sp. Choc4-2]|jgi:hypothetical protein|uniref:DUF4123 domain-containing protein n=1 Tax=unclassified Gilliamella TaxID=2685620 RepID=UPI0004DCEB46|nr:DUF4123 domain-containing protein [Gilliamella apicola]KFA59782.1 hypothetical protein GAPWKB11_0525 [Gilliamella apicola]OCG30563.1 hypothetical protein A9G33_07670 [Gilliamella apicola]OCG44594.1 hypothetical protein A9G34_07100 [Gilliamella apicola]OCG54121.1 hypothetical protein A9G36_08890 [Gilliamella apicola]